MRDSGAPISDPSRGGPAIVTLADAQSLRQARGNKEKEVRLGGWPYRYRGEARFSTAKVKMDTGRMTGRLEPSLSLPAQGGCPYWTRTKVAHGGKRLDW